MEKTYQSRCMAENTKIIEEIVSLRQKQSQLLGYENHAAYIQEVGVRKSNRRTTVLMNDDAAARCGWRRIPAQ